MKVSVQKTFGLILALAVCLSVPACTRFVYKTAYNQADFLVMRELDRYFQLRGDQRSQIDRRLDELHVWHRRKELPRYSATLREFRNRLARGLTAADVDWLFDRGNDFRNTAYRRVYDDALGLLVSLDAKQVRHLRGELAESNAEIEERLSQSRQERMEKRQADTLDFLDDWTGGLREQQSREIAAQVHGLPELDRHRLRYRRERQSEFLSNLPGNGGDRQKLETALQSWMLEPDRSQPAYYRSEILRWRSAVREMTLRIDRSLDDSQRAAVLARLDELIHDLGELSRL